jgi:hypothetical protein
MCLCDSLLDKWYFDPVDMWESIENLIIQLSYFCLSPSNYFDNSLYYENVRTKVQCPFDILPWEMELET